MRLCPELKYFADIFGGTVSICLYDANNREIKANMEYVLNECSEKTPNF